MTQNIYILSSPKHKSIAESLDEQVISNGIFESTNLKLTESVLLDMANDCMVDFFYVIVADKKVQFPIFDFDYKPPLWDYPYVHVWNNDASVRLFNKEEVLKNPSGFTDESLRADKINLKNIDVVISEHPIYDIIFLSFDEPTADENFHKIKSHWPRTKRVNGIKGIRDAHKEAAKLSTTDMFYVVDADAEIIPEFNFDSQLRSHNQFLYTNSVYVWYSLNPVNNLKYGYGGVKLFPTQSVLDYNGNDIDFTTSTADGIIVIPEVANITNFDTDPFSTWRSAFRECVKLSSKVITGQLDKETEHRLNTWCTVGNGKFGEYSIDGATEGTMFGNIYSNQPEMLRLINDFDWLKQKFNS
jgi:hypothetical protein